ncbi:hypothetical protein [Arenibaculum sp.]|jgi:hypothetical protein|uniref:hypothetical protein n=1 Tax=Arenibaculum sp. TaxID=2865862 RepID=UPI002E0E1EA9|nr:hypothetical protein [Arenibaculum sp.]
MPEDEKRHPEGPRRDQRAPDGAGDAVPRTTEENERTAEGGRPEKAPNPGHPV